MAELWDIEDKTDLAITFNNKVISSEGPHGGSGELSMAKVLGIVNEEELENQANVNEYEDEENGVYIDEEYGHRLFNLAINSVIFDIEKLLDF